MSGSSDEKSANEKSAESDPVIIPYKVVNKRFVNLHGRSHSHYQLTKWYIVWNVDCYQSYHDIITSFISIFEPGST